MASNCALILLGLFVCLDKLHASPCFVQVTSVSYSSVTRCVCRIWGRCTMEKTWTSSTYHLYRRCCSGYSGNGCSTPICHCQNGGTCEAPGVCRCPTGYSGYNCEKQRHNRYQLTKKYIETKIRGGASTEGFLRWDNAISQMLLACCLASVCLSFFSRITVTISIKLDTKHHLVKVIKIYKSICFPPCQHGYCMRPQQCSCYTGYRGSRCDTPICSPSCQHGGRCVNPNTCHCPNGYAGHNCNIPICRPACMNGGTCDGNRRCRCTQHYTGSTCITPVCRAGCHNGGTCIAPDKCGCDPTYTGPTCATPMCSYHSPCFPGKCADSIHCQCDSGFDGTSGLNRCKTMTAYLPPIITKCSTFLAFIKRTGRKDEMYRFATDSSKPNSTEIDTLWINQKRYNYFNVRFSAMFTAPGSLLIPPYVQRFKFGIVSGQIQVDLTKIDRNNPLKHFVSINKTILNCPYTPGSLNPDDSVFWCNFTDSNFDRLLEHGDNLTISVIATNGGFRELRLPNTSQNDTFIGQKATKSTRFRFDFVKPVHCITEGNCSIRPFRVSEDITKNPLTFTWDGWSDEMSGIHGFSIQEFLLKPNNVVPPNLTEPDPWHAKNTFQLDANSNTFTRTPSEPGMYSYILNVMDSANNTEFARSLVLYDPYSKVSVSDNASNFAVISGVEETNYLWQDNLKDNVTVSWKDHFTNRFIEDNKLLIPVKSYMNYDFYTRESKYVIPLLDDMDGNRTLKGIQNVHGVVRFEFAFRNVNQGSNSPSHWDAVDNTFSQTQTFNLSRRDGDGINVWVKAIDVLGNVKIDQTKVYFDSTPPRPLTGADVIFTPNTNVSKYPFSSRLNILTRDEDSGIYRINWRLISNNSGIVFKSGHLEGNQSKVDPDLRYGYRIPKGDFYYKDHFLDIDNCWMVVAKKDFQTEFVMLELTVYNMALKSTVYNHTITDLPTLDGMDKYSGPMNLHVTAVYDNSVRLTWTIAPSCYQRTGIIVRFSSLDGQTFVRNIGNVENWLDLTGLKSETSYNLSFVTKYGDELSDPVPLSFKTQESPAALTAGAIAGISIVILVLLGIVVFMVTMWRMGKLTTVKDGLQRRVTVVRTRINNRFSSAHTNKTYEDDLYIYGNMAFNDNDSWILPSSTIILETLITSGRFADIYKAQYRPKGNTMERGLVVAKILKSGYSEENALMMRAKINFFGNQVGEHQNILLFIGAVVDNNAMGPYMILEYCEKGQLRDWLLQQKNMTSDDTIEQLYRIIYGISKGMCHLETKQIVHKKLAARNVLLTNELEPKIYGFGPEPKQKDCSDADGDLKSDDKERIPLKWTAPECVTSMRDATSKSDVWSFGIVVWEIFSFGESPYPGLRSRQIKEEVQNGYRMKRPEFANDFYNKLMQQCWQFKPKQRPTFKDIMGDIAKTFSSAPSDEYYYYTEK